GSSSCMKQGGDAYCAGSSSLSAMAVCSVLIPPQVYACHTPPICRKATSHRPRSAQSPIALALAAPAECATVRAMRYVIVIAAFAFFLAWDLVYNQSVYINAGM